MNVDIVCIHHAYWCVKIYDEFEILNENWFMTLQDAVKYVSRYQLIHELKGCA